MFSTLMCKAKVTFVLNIQKKALHAYGYQTVNQHTFYTYT